MSSMSSAASSASMSFNKVIKDFKKALGERKTPKTLILLNRIMIAIFTITIALSSVDFSLQRTETDKLDAFND